MRIVPCAAALLLATATPASAATTIDFEEFVAGSLGSTFAIGNVTFNSPIDLFIGQYFTNTGTTKALCSRTAGTFGCESALTVTFADPVSGLSLIVDGANSTAAEITALVLLSDRTSRTVVFGGFQPFNPTTLHFGPLPNIRSVMFTTTDPQGFSFDNFTFNESAVPEPATWAMLILGFGLVGVNLRRRRAAKALI